VSAPGTLTHCPYCALQCGMSLRDAGGRLQVGVRDFPVNRGGLCQKGWTSAELLASADRLTTPLVRAHRAAPLRAASWDEALARVAAEIRRSQSEYGPDSVAVFGGGLTNEKAYALGKFARVALGTSNIDYNGRYCMSSAAAAGARAFGVDRGLPFPLSDLAAAETILLVGSNAAETMPPFTRAGTLGVRVARRARDPRWRSRCWPAGASGYAWRSHRKPATSASPSSWACWPACRRSP
jgi:assimilatory nitrate reductase catalytic subunit